MEVKADEAVFDKFLLPSEDSPLQSRVMKWEQWLGMVARGKPSSLVLIRLPCMTTHKRAPGPGAIKKVHWTKIAKTWLKGRNIILHTDSARSYKAKVAGVLHDSVVHQKKRVWKGRKWIWQPPTFVRIAKHTLPDAGGGSCMAIHQRPSEDQPEREMQLHPPAGEDPFRSI